MKKTLLCMLVGCAVLVAACKKDEGSTETPTTPATVEDYLGEFTMESEIIYVVSATGLGELPEDTTHATSGEQQSGERREDGHTPFRVFWQPTTSTF